MSEQWGAGSQPQDPQQPQSPQQQPDGSWAQPQQPQFGGTPVPPQPEPYPGSGSGSSGAFPQPGPAAPFPGAASGEFPQPGPAAPFPGAASGEFPQPGPAAPFPGAASGEFPQQGAPYPGGPGYPSPDYPGGLPPKQSNGFALAGAILCIIPILGLIFSIIGLTRAKALAGAGRTAATVGIVLSLVFAGGYSFLIFKVGNSTAADPACISAESQVNAMQSKLSADETQMKADASSPAESTDFTNAANDLQTIKTSIDGDVGKATHANVKSALQAFDNDLGEMISDFNEIASGNTAGATDLESRLNQMTTDGDNLDSLCGNAVNG